MLKQTGRADVYTDFQGTAQLRSQAKQDPKGALKETAQQFESVFIQMALKRMREATPKSGLMDNHGSEMYQDLHDQQLAVELGKTGKFGIADMLTRQLGGDNPGSGPNGKTLDDYRQTALYRPLGMVPRARTTGSRPDQADRSGAASGPPGNREQFMATLWPHAQAAAAEIGVDPKLLLAQAALETGWGKSMHSRSGGNNLFGIKADRRWDGAKVNASTLEFADGAMVRGNAAFRSYASYSDSFQDYVSFLKSNPRYQDALSKAHNPRQFIMGLQKAGYATDPAYARKVLAIYDRQRALGSAEG
jgi:flagellar protein FlgJ